MSNENLDVLMLKAMVQSGAIKLVPVPALTAINKTGYVSQINKNVNTLKTALKTIRYCLQEAEKAESKS